MRSRKRVVSTLLALAAVTLASASAATAGGDQRAKNDKRTYFDSRDTPSARAKLDDRAAKLSSNPSAAVDALRTNLGDEAVVTIDPLTSTPRMVGRLDGFLTGPSSASADSIALGYVRANATAFGLDAASLASLKLVRDYVSIDGTHHLSYRQAANGVSVFGNGLKANVTNDGQLINVVGSPVGTLGSAPAASPGISAAQAVSAARSDAELAIVPARTLPGGTATSKSFTTGDEAKLVYFQAVDNLRLAWQTLLWGDQAYQTIVDAASGRILYRKSLVNYANGKIWDNYPGAALGGTQRTVDLTPYLTRTDRLFGNNAVVYSDVNDNDARDAGEDVVPGEYTFTPFTNPPAVNSACSALFPCSWNSSFPSGRNSYQTNREQNAVQVFYFLNHFHDHLAAAPIGFTEAAGNFQIANASGQGAGGDPVVGQNDDGANTLCCIGGQPVGMPDPSHIDNANMATPPDGFAPRMQMYLFNDPLSNPPFSATHDDPFIQSNGGDEAGIVYHEYTHGLSNRLVVDADGNSTLGNIQAGSMGEAWSDWYAYDFLVNEGYYVDTPADGDIRVGDYVGAGEDLIRTQPLDCAVGSTSSKCPGTPGAGAGGYTYGDFGKVIGRPEVHADGEIWAETLWDLRTTIGSAAAEGLVTRAMELSPPNPSFLDMRNSILQADQAGNRGRLHDTIWNVFAKRGMGYFAAAIDGDDAQPVESMALPPRGKAKEELKGRVTDADTGLALQGILVAFGGHASGFRGDLSDLTNRKGEYEIDRIFPGVYPKVFAKGAGYDLAQATVTIADSNDRDGRSWRDRRGKNKDNVQNFVLRRDWASLLGGGSIASFNGPDYTDFGCGPTGAIDQSEGNGWGSSTDDDDANVTGNVTPKFIVVQLPVAVNVSEIQVNPSNTCGDPGSSSTRGYRIQVSSDGTTFTTLTEGVFYAANRAKENVVFTGTQGSVRYVKFWMLNPQVPTDPTVGASCTNAADCGTNPDDNSGVAAHCGDGKDNGYGGCQFMDMSEIKIYGRPA